MSGSYSSLKVAAQMIREVFQASKYKYANNLCFASLNCSFKVCHMPYPSLFRLVLTDAL